METETVLFNAVPLFMLAAAYTAVSVVILPALWRDRRKAPPGDIPLAAAFPCGAVAELLLCVVGAERGEPAGGHTWLAFVSIVLLLVPAVLFFTRIVDGTQLLSGPRFEESEARRSELDRDFGAVTRIAAAL